MSFTADFYNHLMADSAIAALIAERLWPVIRDEGNATLPAVTYQIIAADPASDLDGGDGNLIQYRVQIDSWSDKYDEARTLAEAVRTRLQTASATIHALPLPGSGGDLYEPETKLHRVSQDFSLWYAVP